MNYHDKSYAPLKTFLAESFAKVPPGYRGILYYFQIQHFPALFTASSSNTPSIDDLSEIIATDPYPLLYNLLAMTYANHKDFERARATFQVGVKIFPKNPQLWNSWTFFELKHGSKEIALHACRETLDRDVTNAKAWRALLKLQTANGAGDVHLVDVLMEALAACPSDPVLRLQLARIEEKRKGGKAALQVLDSIRHLNHPDVMRTIGRILFEQGDWANGRIYLRKAVDFDSRFINQAPQFSANTNNSSSINGKNRKNQSRSSSDVDRSANTTTINNESETELELDDDLSIGSSLMSKQNRKGQARTKSRYSSVHKALKALHAWSIKESKVGNIDEARSLLSEARALCQTDSGIWRAIAELESREKNYDEARRAFQNAVDINPHDARLILAWSRTEALAGNTEKAEELINRVDKLPPNRKKGVAHLLPSEPIKRAKKVQPVSRGDFNSNRSRNLSKLFDVQNSSSSTLDVVYDDDDEEEERKNNQTFIDSNNSISENYDGNEVDDNYDSRQKELTPHILAGALRERAITASREGRLVDCVRLLSRASSVDPSNETTWRLLASNEFQRTGSIDSLRSIYQEGLKKIPVRLKHLLLHWWGQEERLNGNINEARELLFKSTVSNPDYMSAWMSLGLLEKSCGNIVESCRIFEQATKRAERDAIRAPYVFQTWGNVELKERKRMDVAANIFERGVNLAPSAAGLWTDWGLLEYRRGNHVKSRQLLKKAIQANERFIDSWIILAKLECDRCNFKSSGHFFEVAMNGGVDQSNRVNSSNNNNARRFNNYSRSYGGGSSRTKDGMGREYVNALVAWARMEGEILGNIAVSRDLYERALEIDDKLGDALRGWGVMEMRGGNLNQARDLFERCSLIHGEEIEGWYLLGVLAWDKYNDADEAVKMWNKVLQHDDSHSATYKEWGKMEVARGNIARARVQFSKGVTIIKDSKVNMPSSFSTTSATASNEGFVADDSYIGLMLSWGWMEYSQGNIKKSNELVSNVLQIADNTWEAWELLAAIEGDKDNTQQKLQVLKQGMEKCKGGDCGRLYLQAAEVVMHQSGNLEEARRLWKTGLNARPANLENWKGVIELEKKYGTPDSIDKVSKVEYKVFSRRSADCENEVLRFINE